MPPNRTRFLTAEDLATLRDAVERLTERLDHLTLTMDELFTELQWRNRQHSPDYSPEPPFVLTSLPLDPAAKDWQINRVALGDLPAAPARSAAVPGQLF